MSSRSRTKSTSHRTTGNERILRFSGPQPAQSLFRDILQGLPPIDGRPVRVKVRPEILVARGRLVSGQGRGDAVHGAANIRGRLILLEEALFGDPANLRRIFLHELLHFAWVRLSNEKRRSFEEILRREFERGARGELGWSSELRKRLLAPFDIEQRTRKWREYCCESFCDSGAWWLGGEESHPECTLARRYRGWRSDWYRNQMASGARIAL